MQSSYAGSLCCSWFEKLQFMKSRPCCPGPVAVYRAGVPGGGRWKMKGKEVPPSRGPTRACPWGFGTFY